MNTKKGTWPLANPPLTTGTIREQTYTPSKATTFDQTRWDLHTEFMMRSESQPSQDLYQLVEETVLIDAVKPNS
jgi:hypothetical protein